MTILEATVEITKAVVGSSGNVNVALLLTTESTRNNFLNGIDALYKKLDALDANNLKK
jgi:hypothetical protein